MPKSIQLEVPVLLIAAAFFLITAFQTERLVQERGNLNAIRATQAVSLEQAGKVRDRFQLLAGETAKLAEIGEHGREDRARPATCPRRDRPAVNALMAFLICDRPCPMILKPTHGGPIHARRCRSDRRIPPSQAPVG